MAHAEFDNEQIHPRTEPAPQLGPHILPTRFHGGNWRWASCFWSESIMKLLGATQWTLTTWEGRRSPHPRNCAGAALSALCGLLAKPSSETPWRHPSHPTHWRSLLGLYGVWGRTLWCCRSQGWCPNHCWETLPACVILTAGHPVLFLGSCWRIREADQQNQINLN